MVVDTELLKKAPHFSGLSPDEIESIKEHVFERTAQDGDLISLEGEPADTMYFVVKGIVKVYRTSPGGRDQILYFVRPGDSFNEVSVLDGGPNLGNAQAIGKVVLYGITSRDLEVIISSYPKVAMNLSRTLARQIRRLASLVEDLSFRNVMSRVAKILLEQTTDGSEAKPRLTQQDMASLAGTAREMVGRSLKSLEEEGAIRMERHRIIIRDQGLLSEIAGR
ncbi:MAG: Crp/Fnr family transcriptional regulator [Dehalococcoidia bacterium]|nr:Crp/Fnr family transcriptional regulator [Dehalococcoidia bacterium]